MTGSLYDSPNPNTHPDLSSSLPMPTPSSYRHFTSIANACNKLQVQQQASPMCNTHVGLIIPRPFFSSNRGELAHPDEVNRGLW